MIDITDQQLLAVSAASSINGVVEVLESGMLSYHLDTKKSVYFDSLELEFPEAQSFNFLEMESDYSLKLTISISEDKKSWQRIPVVHEMKESGKQIWKLSLVTARYVQLNIYPGAGGLFSHYQARHIALRRQFHHELSSTSHLDRNWVAENLIDGREDYGWASPERAEATEDEIIFSVDHPVNIAKIMLQAVHDESHCFPHGFSVDLSLDQSVWTSVISESGFMAAPGQWYFWNTLPVRARYVRITVYEPFQKKKDLYCSRILALKVFVFSESEIQPGLSTGTHAYASEALPGIVTFAEEGSYDRQKAVQGSDFRLKAASTVREGIVRLAQDNETADNAAVQGSDSRLRDATEQYPGIAQLARDNEVKEKAVVQSTDSRLKKATDENYGIVQFAKNGMENSGLAVQANDLRLRRASEDNSGIVQLAKDGGMTPGTVVQGGDSRLKEAGTSRSGIMRFASHGEELELRAVQGDDPRLREASEEHKGRVRLARDREDEKGKAVQGNDSRLKPADEKNSGIVFLAAHKQSEFNRVLRSDDPRLFDAREPLEHRHDEYSPRDHSLNDHSGSLQLEIDSHTQDIRDWSAPDGSTFPLYIKNGEGYAAYFQGGMIARGGDRVGLTAVSKKGVALEARSRDEKALTAFSAEDYAVFLPAELHGTQSSGRSLYAEGEVRLSGGVQIEKGKSVAFYFEAFTGDVFQQGDLLTLREGRLSQVREKSDVIVGVYQKDPAFVFGEKKNHSIAIAVAGLVDVRVKGPVRTGDLLCFGKENPGVAGVCSKEGRAVFVAAEDLSSGSEGIAKAFFVK